MSRDKQIEERCPCQTEANSCCACVSMKCHECFKPMQSKFVQGRFCSNCGRPLKADVQRNYRKASDVAREIFEEIEKHSEVALMNGHIDTPILCIGIEVLADLKKKHESEGAG